MENKEIHQPFDKLDELSLPTGDVIPEPLNQLLSLYKQRLKTIELTRWYYSLPPRCTRSRCWPKVSKWGFHANSSKKKHTECICLVSSCAGREMSSVSKFFQGYSTNTTSTIRCCNPSRFEGLRLPRERRPCAQHKGVATSAPAACDCPCRTWDSGKIVLGRKEDRTYPKHWKESKGETK